jgi:hypothetical protein
MASKAKLEAVYAASEDVVAREIEGELIIIPITNEVGNAEAELYSLNETGQAIWSKLDGKKKLKEIVECLALEFSADKVKIKNDVLGLADELLKRRMLVEIKAK